MALNAARGGGESPFGDRHCPWRDLPPWRPALAVSHTSTSHCIPASATRHAAPQGAPASIRTSARPKASQFCKMMLHSGRFSALLRRARSHTIAPVVQPYPSCSGKGVFFRVIIFFFFFFFEHCSGKGPQFFGEAVPSSSTALCPGQLYGSVPAGERLGKTPKRASPYKTSSLLSPSRYLSGRDLPRVTQTPPPIRAHPQGAATAPYKSCILRLRRVAFWHMNVSRGRVVWPHIHYWRILYVRKNL